MKAKGGTKNARQERRESKKWYEKTKMLKINKNVKRSKDTSDILKPKAKSEARGLRKAGRNWRN